MSGATATAGVGGRRPPVRPHTGPPLHVRRRRARLAVAVILLLAVTIGAVGWWLGAGRWTTVPSLTGQTRDVAIGLLQEAGLDPVCCEQRFDETVPAGTVLEAAPDGGRAIRGSDVRLTVSRGPERFVVDAALAGKPRDRVLAELKNLPVKVAAREQYTDTVAAGLVIGFEPPAGTALRRDQAVTVLVSKGRKPVAVPNVVGLAPEDATKNLQDLGFRVARGADGRSAAVPAGKVMAVTPNPSAGPIDYGSTVSIQVSAGVPQVAVPDVRGKRADEAAQALQAAGLKVSTQTFIAGDRVYRQSPEPGQTVDTGTTVTILLSFG